MPPNWLRFSSTVSMPFLDANMPPLDANMPPLDANMPPPHKPLLGHMCRP